jgi:site-specific DNA-methyltransferase (adenine-specific)
MGTGTTAMVARQLGRNYIGYEINSEYFKYIKEKTQVAQDMFFGM